jgi:hypothetical protein
MLFWIGLAAALGAGIYVGLGMPGMSGREDRMVSPGKARREARYRNIDWLKPFSRR